MVTIGEFLAFRRELVEAERTHPEWRKTIDRFGGVHTPESPEAETYWRLRNGAGGIVRHMNNELDGLAGIPGYVRYVSDMNRNGAMPEDDARLVKKWMAEWDELCERAETGKGRTEPHRSLSDQREAAVGACRRDDADKESPVPSVVDREV